MFGRILINTIKQIKRSGWVGWSSIAVMTLAFFVASIFAGLAYLSNVYIQFIETRDNVLVFFDIGTDPVVITKLREKWEALPEIKSIGFTSEEQAYYLYLDETQRTKPIEYQLLSEYTEKKLLSSLDIQLYSLDDINEVRQILVDDINIETEAMDVEVGETPIDLRIDDETLDELKQVFSALRIGGAVVLGLLFIIIFFFTLMTVEFRTYNRMEEIGVMQLVGGSLWYIRAPYILEGAYYGFVGALVSSAILIGLIFAIFVLNPQSALALFIYERLSPLPLPKVTLYGWLALGGISTLVGALLGGLSSYLAIRRYIK